MYIGDGMGGGMAARQMDDTKTSTQPGFPAVMKSLVELGLVPDSFVKTVGFCSCCSPQSPDLVHVAQSLGSLNHCSKKHTNLITVSYHSPVRIGISSTQVPRGV